MLQRRPRGCGSRWGSCILLLSWLQLQLQLHRSFISLHSAPHTIKCRLMPLHPCRRCLKVGGLTPEFNVRSMVNH